MWEGREGTYGEVREVGGEVVDAGPGVHPDPGVDYTTNVAHQYLIEHAER
jgi:hypothetical protein